MSTAKLADTIELLNILGEMDALSFEFRDLGRIGEGQALTTLSGDLYARVDLGYAELVETHKTADLLDEDGIVLVRTAEPHTQMTPQQRQKIKKELKKHRPVQKKWLCCTRPTLRKIKGGVKVWVSTCKYHVLSGKNKGHEGSMTRIVGKDPKTRPQKLKLKGQPVKWCA